MIKKQIVFEEKKIKLFQVHIYPQNAIFWKTYVPRILNDLIKFVIKNFCFSNL